MDDNETRLQELKAVIEELKPVDAMHANPGMDKAIRDLTMHILKMKGIVIGETPVIPPSRDRLYGWPEKPHVVVEICPYGRDVIVAQLTKSGKIDQRTCVRSCNPERLEVAQLPMSEIDPSTRNWYCDPERLEVAS